MERAHPSRLIAGVSRVESAGQVQTLGTLELSERGGFVMRGAQGRASHHDGLPWWLFDAHPQGYLGRAYARRSAGELGLPPRLADWCDADVIQALKQHGRDLVGDLLVSEPVQRAVIDLPQPPLVALTDRIRTYGRLSERAEAGELSSSLVGGEQPKFTGYVETNTGPAHVIVKFSAREDNAVSERWRDLLLAEHHALETLHEAGVPAARFHRRQRRPALSGGRAL